MLYEPIVVHIKKNNRYNIIAIIYIYNTIMNYDHNITLPMGKTNISII